MGVVLPPKNSIVSAAAAAGVYQCVTHVILFALHWLSFSYFSLATR
jgi:hypothetical protein